MAKKKPEPKDEEYKWDTGVDGKGKRMTTNERYDADRNKK